MEIPAEVLSGKQGRSQAVKSKYNRRTAQAANTIAKEQPLVQRRVFGTARNTNVPDKVVPEKPKWQKPSLKPTLTTPPAKPPIKTTSGRKPLPTKPSPKPLEPVQVTPPVPEEPPKTTKPTEKKNKKSVSFLEGIEGVGPTVETPGPTAKKKISGTPYHTAERCSKCRFDKMEMASYWLTQIKLAESVDKHFVSSALFKLALESKAEPIRSLRVELNRYISRHSYLWDEAEWRDVTTNYGLNVTPNNQIEVKAGDENGGDLDQAPADFTEQINEQLENDPKD